MTRRTVTGGQLQQPFTVFDTLEDALIARPRTEIPTQRSGDADTAGGSGTPAVRGSGPTHAAR